MKSGSPVVAAGSSESEVLAQELESLGEEVRADETRLAEVERIIKGLEKAALTAARALEELFSSGRRKRPSASPRPHARVQPSGRRPEEELERSIGAESS